MSNVKRLIIADCHIGQGIDDAAAMGALVRRAASEGVAEVVYLGDAFQYLIGISKFWTSSVHEVIESWREVRRQGVRIVVIEGNRERVQAFEGVCIAIRNRGLNSAFTVRKISHGTGVERVFQTYSPLIDSIKVKRRGDVRRAKLYYLRGLEGRAARIKEKLN